MSKLIQNATLLLAGAAIGAVAMSGVPDTRGARKTAPESAPTAAPKAVASAPQALPEVAPDAAPLAVVVKPLDPPKEPIQPIPAVREFFEDYLEIEYDADKIELGRMLFHDPRLSADDSISCASCHDLRYGGIDRASAATGVAGQLGPINTPTVFNSAFNVMQFWDGRAESLENQAGGPPLAPKEMNSNWDQINAKLLADERIVAQLKKVYALQDPIPADLDKHHWLEALADFERTLVTPNAPFDRYLAGDVAAISQEAKEGYQLFKDVGCTECHNGIAVGAKSFQKLGRKNPYFGAHVESVDLGRFNVTGRDEDRHVFKVPGLRNVALTGPWFHDGSKASLRDAIESMAIHQIGRELAASDVAKIAEFLTTLTGTFEGRPLAATSNP